MVLSVNDSMEPNTRQLLGILEFHHVRHQIITAYRRSTDSLSDLNNLLQDPERAMLSAERCSMLRM